MSTTRVCRRCGSATRPRNTPPGPEALPLFGGRGLCGRCYNRLSRSGGLVDYPRCQRPRRDVLEDWKIYRARGWSIREAAAAMGMKATALDRALCRARRAGVEVG